MILCFDCLHSPRSIETLIRASDLLHAYDHLLLFLPILSAFPLSLPMITLRFLANEWQSHEISNPIVANQAIRQSNMKRAAAAASVANRKIQFLFYLLMIWPQAWELLHEWTHTFTAIAINQIVLTVYWPRRVGRTTHNNCWRVINGQRHCAGIEIARTPTDSCAQFFIATIVSRASSLFSNFPSIFNCRYKSRTASIPAKWISPINVHFCVRAKRMQF